MQAIRNWLIAYGANPPVQNFIPLFDTGSLLPDIKSLPHIPSCNNWLNNSFLSFFPLTPIPGDIWNAWRFRISFWRESESEIGNNVATGLDGFAFPASVLNYKPLSWFWQQYLLPILSHTMPASLLGIIADYVVDLIAIKNILNSTIIPIEGFGHFQDQINCAFKSLQRTSTLAYIADFLMYHAVHVDDTLIIHKFEQNGIYNRGLAIKLWLISISEALLLYQKTKEAKNFARFKQTLKQVPTYISVSKGEVSIADNDENYEKFHKFNVDFSPRKISQIIPKMQREIFKFAKIKKTPLTDPKQNSSGMTNSYRT